MPYVKWKLRKCYYTDPHKSKLSHNMNSATVAINLW